MNASGLSEGDAEDREGEVDGQEGARRAGADHVRARWLSGLVIVAAGVWLMLVLLGPADQGVVVGAVWVRVVLFVCLVAGCAALLIRALNLPRPVDAPPLDALGGLGVEGPERRRLRRAIRERTPLHPGDCERALTRARQQLARATRRDVPARERYFLAAVVAYLGATTLYGSASWTAPSFEFSDVKTLAFVVIAAAGGWVLSRPGTPGRRSREQRARRQIELLENHPIAE